ncbi:uncharacterized protein N7518_003689 [Penicillium psychrosexuale]|uniref:uncharacterized protein n=1 Tax=Penicillium psychrosexuale TaxID=1002107 RepID=UPI002545629B|nr:uncharacterized protein N7518_003689 [Penicillium psychrosexuale]KAJ5801621.1 hypothetical protein N7518_003689 [Penicillium psychrosexuale]
MALELIRSAVFLLALYFHAVHASPNATEIFSSNRSTFSVLTSRDAEDFTLRILPLGASITAGYLSSDSNGYRKALRAQLRHAGWVVNMVGSVSTGTMHDNNHEGHPGYRIEQVQSEAKKSITSKPNLILINAGTNDATQKYQTDTAGDRMDTMIDYLYSSVPNVTIILSTLLPNTAQPALVGQISVQYRRLYMRRKAAGDKIVIADMQSFISVDDLQDDTHPTDDGYIKMASIWWPAIQEAQTNGFLTPPADTDVSDTSSSTCEKTFASGENNYAQTQRGSGTDDGNYIHNSEDKGRILKITAVGNIHEGINFAQLVNTGGAYREGALDELIQTVDGAGTYMYLNNNNGEFGDPVKIDVKDSCVHWGDVNNDGLDDFICISREGAMYVSINKGGNPPTFQSIGLVMAAPGSGLAQENVRLGDIDGDGRLDYCLIQPDGDIQCWRNGGQNEAPTTEYGGYWQDLGIVFTGKNMGNITGVRLVDLNGDFRSDWLWMDDEGKVTTYINNRGTGKNSLVPDWVSAGVTHAGMGVEGAKERIKFGLVYGGSTKGADYVYIESVQTSPSTGGAAPIYNHYTHVWKNVGSGGRYLKGDGVYYCDMRGTGADDYIWVSPDGIGYLYGNIHSPPVWSPEGPKIFETGKERKAIHLADFDGDGKCDLWLVDRATGAAEVWINNWNSKSGTMSWDKRGIVSGSAKCVQGWGVGLYDIGLRFHDINADGRADYLCIEPDGRTTGALNKGENNFEDVGQIKHTEGYDRANHKWADVDGDGLLDFLWVDKFNGDTSVWKNKGRVADGKLVGGSTFEWEALGARYQGADRGANMHFPNLGGLGRADYHQVIPRTNKAYTWFNVCSGGSGKALDDEDPSIDPGLPALTVPHPFWPLPHNYISYGDSYAAGIGAHCGWIIDEFDESTEGIDCRRCEGLYPYQLLSAGPELNGKELRFPSCSGAVINDMENANANGREGQIIWVRALDYYKSSGWGTLSIGGNDLGFADIVISCILWWNSNKCDAAMGRAGAKVRDPAFKLKLADLYNNILLDAMGGRQPENHGFLLVVTGYAQFFYDKDGECDESYFWRGGYLKQELRMNVNALVVELNNVIKEAVIIAQDAFGGNYKTDYNIKFFDTDVLFEGHRFCEPNKDYHDSWFFVILGADALADGTVVSEPSATDGGIDTTTYWQSCQTTDADIWTDMICEYSKAVHDGTPMGQANVTEDGDDYNVMVPREAAKVMHPKTVGYKQISDGIYKLVTSL